MSILVAVALIGTTAAVVWIGGRIADLVDAAVRWACRH